MPDKGVGDVSRVQNAVHNLGLGVWFREDLNLCGTDHQLSLVITLWLRGEHLRVHLEENLQILHHGLVGHHVGVQDAFDAILSPLSVLLLGEMIEDVGLRLVANGIELGAMHVLQRGSIVVLHGELMPHF